MKTLTQLKRDAKSGKVFAEMIIRQGTTDIPESLKGKRKIVDANSVGITFLNNNGKKSELRIESASLVEYDDNSLTIYDPGLRELTVDEQAIFDKWELKKDRKQEEVDALTDGSTSYWQQKHFFIDAGYEYLLGTEKKQGKKYDWNTKKVYDNSIKGNVSMKYILC
jgi:hypothetical protein